MCTYWNDTEWLKYSKTKNHQDTLDHVLSNRTFANLSHSHAPLSLRHWSIARISIIASNDIIYALKMYV